MRLIIDTDTAGDDVFSLLIALRHPRVKLEAITICHGNVGLEQHAENALLTVEMAGKDVPVYVGAERPLHRKPLTAAYVFGRDGMSDANFAKAKISPAEGHAVDALIERVMAAPGEITIVAQAPLTNIALAVRKEPRFAASVARLWVMGGTDHGMGNVTPAAEYNFYVDPEAAQIVLEAGFRLSLVTWTLTLSGGLVTDTELGAIERLDTPLSRFFTTVNRSSLAYSRSRQKLSGSLHPDALTCACAVDNTIVTASEPCTVEIETEGRMTRGYSSVSSPQLPDAADADPDLVHRPPNADVVKAVDRARFVSLLTQTLKG
jgi:purine nucleosidase